jgi:type I restriction enzyme, R subunit
VDALPEGIRKSEEAAAEAIENNVRKLIIDEQPINPKYYEKMSELLDALIEQRRKEALDYQEYLRQIVELTKKVTNPEVGGSYPKTMNTGGKRALYDNLGKDEALVLAVDAAVRGSRQDDWRNNLVKVKRVRNAIKAALDTAGTQTSDGGGAAYSTVVREGPSVYSGESSESLEDRVERVLVLVKNQDEY